MMYYFGMGMAALFGLSLAGECISVLINGPSWKSVFKAAGCMMFAIIFFIVGIANYTPPERGEAGYQAEKTIKL